MNHNNLLTHEKKKTAIQNEYIKYKTVFKNKWKSSR